MILCSGSGTSGESTTHSSRHENPIWAKYERRMVQQIVQMACRRDATSASEHRGVEADSSLVQRIATNKRPNPVDKQDPERGTQNATTGILLSDVI